MEGLADERRRNLNNEMKPAENCLKGRGAWLVNGMRLMASYFWCALWDLLCYRRRHRASIPHEAQVEKDSLSCLLYSWLVLERSVFQLTAMCWHWRSRRVIMGAYLCIIYALSYRPSIIMQVENVSHFYSVIFSERLKNVHKVYFSFEVCAKIHVLI